MATLIGLNGENAVCLVVEEFRNVQEPAPIPLHPEVDQHVSSKIWDRPRKNRNVTHRVVVSRAPIASNAFDLKDSNLKGC